jgi:hypothetical protein
MPKVKSFHGCFGRLNRDALTTTGIRSGEWTHVRGRKTKGMSEKEISKFLASKALKDASFVRELEVAPKKMMLNHASWLGIPRSTARRHNHA